MLSPAEKAVRLAKRNGAPVYLVHEGGWTLYDTPRLDAAWVAYPDGRFVQVTGAAPEGTGGNEP
jgi:hypothetical protein